MYLDGLIGRIYRISNVVGPATHSVLSTDTARAIMCSTAGGAVTVLLPAAPTTGVFLHVKDSSGNAAANNITVSGNGKLLDGAATLLINSNSGSLSLVYNGVGWSSLAIAAGGGGGGTPGGADKDFQYRVNGTTLGGATGFTRETTHNRFDTTTRWLEIGPVANPYATAGTVRTSKDFTLKTMSQASALLTVLQAGDGVNDILTLGGTSTQTEIFTQICAHAGVSVQLGITSSTNLFLTSGLTQVYSGRLAFGASGYASTGELAFGNNDSVYWRDQADANNFRALTVSATNNFHIWTTDAAAGSVYFDIPTTQSLIFQDAASPFNRLVIGQNEIQAGKPLVGDSAASSPYGVHGGVTHAFASDANYTLTAAQYKYDWIQLDTGSLATDGRSVFVPLPSSNARAYYKTFANDTPFSINIATVGGDPDDVLIRAGYCQRVYVSNDGVFSVGIAQSTPSASTLVHAVTMQLGPAVGNYPSTGTLRLTDATSIQARNGNNTANISIADWDINNDVSYGQLMAGGSEARKAYLNGSDSVYLSVAGSSRLFMTSSLITSAIAAIQWGATVASPTLNQADDAGNSVVGDALKIIAQVVSGISGTGGALQLYAGNATGGSGTRTGGALDIRSGTGASADGACDIKQGATSRFSWDASGNIEITPGAGGHIRLDGSIKTGQPVIGNTSMSSPYSAHGGATLAYTANTNYTVPAADYVFDFLDGTTANSSPIDVTWVAPTTKARGYYKRIRNASGQNFVHKTGSATTTRTQATGTIETIWVEPNIVRPIATIAG